MIFEQKKNIFIISLKEFLLNLEDGIIVQLSEKHFFKDVQIFLAHMEFGEVDNFLLHDRFLTVIVFFSLYFAPALRRFVIN